LIWRFRLFTTLSASFELISTFALFLGFLILQDAVDPVGASASLNASAAVSNFFRGANYLPLNAAAAAFEQGQSGGGDVRQGGVATAKDDTGGGASGASSSFVPDEKLTLFLEGYKKLASKLSKLNKKTSSPSLECNTCALVYSSEKEGTEFVSLADLKKLHALGEVAVLSVIEITYFAVNLSKPWAKFGKDDEICPTFLQIQNRVASVLEGALGETVKKYTALVITDAVIAQAAPMASLDSSGTLAPPHDTPPPHSSPTMSLRSTSLHRRPQAVGRSGEGIGRVPRSPSPRPPPQLHGHVNAGR